jgi:hypothetical protein
MGTGQGLSEYSLLISLLHPANHKYNHTNLNKRRRKNLSEHMQKIVTVHKTYARSLHQISANTKENWFTHIHHVFGSKAWMHTDIYICALNLPYIGLGLPDTAGSKKKLWPFKEKKNENLNFKTWEFNIYIWDIRPSPAVSLSHPLF